MNKLQKHLSDSGLAKSDFAKSIGISRGYLSDLMSGRRRPTLELAFQIQAETKGDVPAESWLNNPMKEAS